MEIIIQYAYYYTTWKVLYNQLYSLDLDNGNRIKLYPCCYTIDY